MYQKPRYGQNDAVWVDREAVDREAEQPVKALKGQVLFYIGRRTYEVALSSQGVRVVQEQALSIRTRGERR
jgi:hypothetical protein